MLSGVTSLMTIVSHSSRKCWELVCLHHHDEAGTELKIPIPNVNSRPNKRVGNSKGAIVAEGLGHDWTSGWCGVTSSTVGRVTEEEATRDHFFLRSASKF
jgi:hypothetical protein